MNARFYTRVVQSAVTVAVVAGGWLWWKAPGDHTAGAAAVAGLLALAGFLYVRGRFHGDLEGTRPRRWWMVAAAGFLLSVVGSLHYGHQLETRTYRPKAAPEGREVAGTERTEAGKRYGELHPDASKADLVHAFRSDPAEVWTEDSISRSHLILAVSYVGMVVPLLVMFYAGTEAFLRTVADPFPEWRADLARMRGAGYRIFISYRRADSAYIVGRLRTYLEDALGGESVFLDVDSIRAGEDFPKEIADGIGQAQVFLAVIGKEWLRGMDRPVDFVREEVRIALERGVPVLPVFVEGQAMPEPGSLPESIRALAERNGVPLRADPDFEGDARRLLGELVSLWRGRAKR
jgi:hypothetical protein